MKLLTFLVESPVGNLGRPGALVDGERVVDLRSAHAQRLIEEGAHPPRAEELAAELFGSIEGLVALGAWGRAEAEAAIEVAGKAGDGSAAQMLALDSVQLLPPLRPPSFRDASIFEEHVRAAIERMGGDEVPPAFYELPVYYKGNPDTLIGHEATVPWPAYTSWMDYELELALVIGPGGEDISVDDAAGHIYGLAVLNDFSARDIQRQEMSVGLGPAKGKDFASALGPCLVTTDEIPDLYDLEMVARVNGEEWSRGNTGSAHWRFEQLINHISRSERLRPGDVIGSGTVGGGCGLELGLELQPGDLVELEISRLGTLRNLLGSPSKAA